LLKLCTAGRSRRLNTEIDEQRATATTERKSQVTVLRLMMARALSPVRSATRSARPPHIGCPRAKAYIVGAVKRRFGLSREARREQVFAAAVEKIELSLNDIRYKHISCAGRGGKDSAKGETLSRIRVAPLRLAW
jgi:hypothetical protein